MKHNYGQMFIFILFSVPCEVFFIWVCVAKAIPMLDDDPFLALVLLIGVGLVAVLLGIYIIIDLVLMIKRVIYLAVWKSRGFDVLAYEERERDREFRNNWSILVRNKGKW